MDSAPYTSMGGTSSKRTELLADFGMLTLRLVVSSLLVHHGLDKIQNAAGFSAGVVGKNFGFLPGSPLMWTYIAAGMEIVAPIFLALGVFARLAAFGLMMTMCFADTF